MIKFFANATPPPTEWPSIFHFNAEQEKEECNFSHAFLDQFWLEKISRFLKLPEKQQETLKRGKYLHDAIEESNFMNQQQKKKRSSSESKIFSGCCDCLLIDEKMMEILSA